MEGVVEKPQIQLTGFKYEEKEILIQLLLKLDCVFLNSEQYKNCTHLIAKRPCKSEKFLAACAAGKWVLTKDYIINSAESGRWLDETTYEWGYKIKNDSLYSPQMQSAPKRWREKLSHSGATGAFHRWNVVLLIISRDKREDSLIRVLKAGKANIYATLSTPKDITHVLTNNTILNQGKLKHLFGAPCYPIRYLGTYLLENEIKSNVEEYQKKNVKYEQKSRGTMVDTQFDEIKNALIKHIYYQQAVLSKYTQMGEKMECNKELENASCSRKNKILEELVDDNFFPIAVTEFFSGKDCIPPAKLIHSLLEHILQGNSDPTLSVQFFHMMYTLLERNPPWKSPSTLRYYLEILQCPVCKNGTWSLMDMLVRSCLYHNNICHSVMDPKTTNTDRTFHKKLLTFVMNLFDAEVLALTRRLYEESDSHKPLAMPQTVLLNTFWLKNDSVLFNKQINILIDWVIYSYREKYRTIDVFKHKIAEILNSVLGAVVEYWILSGFIMDRNMLHSVADDLASYIAISCDDFSYEELKVFISSIPSLWLEMFVAEAVFKNLYFQNSTLFSNELLSLQKMVSCYLPTLQAGVCEKGKMQKEKKKKIGQWPCSESQRALLMLSGDKQNQAKVLPDVPVQTKDNFAQLPKYIERKTKPTILHGKENCHSSANHVNVHKINLKGETALHIACKSNNVKKLVRLLTVPGIDINVKDYAGWTPLHEACNHGGTVCVREILQHCPEVNLFSQVDGVTPLHDALSNGHVAIAELLLQHGGSILLQQKDSKGKLPLDYIKCPATKQHLLNIVMPEQTVEEFHAQVQSNFYNQRKELWIILFCKMLLNLCSVYNLFKPFPITFKNLGCSDAFLVTDDCYKLNMNSSNHWLIDLYFRELETFHKLPEYLQKTIEDIKDEPGEQKQAFFTMLQQIIITVQMSGSYLANKPQS
ncbi:SMC5-SMC6 complex localization factor protein 1 isoform X3 [Crotalus tigris]|nr:SMC5-SMC6 complex localization factor protein 1 isoform X3 [Crotalus tigris]XP_039191630.1 SMC5-SMC6 complex localization factor protein 1 isoform X3 [Crotalus tigris]XP_039191631.1 SMC5-SMC6 complex localization factor protein 1 isoform X3 [Crotalus tigris]XP_039191632.1 SMC5-SMC6 complex localization factor protein 1 isoform X3 [Crotalus tigris]